MNFIKLNTFIFISLFASASLSSQEEKLDYSDEKNWAALPTKKDNADLMPDEQDQDKQIESPVDVFFVHPTSFNEKIENDNWNTSIENEKVNFETDSRSIKYQASLFNQVGKVYAPRYRQANFKAYFEKNPLSKKAFDLAYKDVVDAFYYYMEHYNQGRPFIIASHSQGSDHSMRLIRDHIQGTKLEKQMVVAYIVGMPLPKDLLAIPPCKSPEQTGCVCSWRTYLKGVEPDYVKSEKEMIVTNPITWKAEEGLSPIEAHKGAVLLDFEKGPLPKIVRAEVKNNILWITKPDISGKLFLTRKNYHMGDYNLFYKDVQENANLRVQTYLGKRTDQDNLEGSVIKK